MPRRTSLGSSQSCRPLGITGPTGPLGCCPLVWWRGSMPQHQLQHQFQPPFQPPRTTLTPLHIRQRQSTLAGPNVHGYGCVRAFCPTRGSPNRPPRAQEHAAAGSTPPVTSGGGAAAAVSCARRSGRRECGNTGIGAGVGWKTLWTPRTPLRLQSPCRATCCPTIRSNCCCLAGWIFTGRDEAISPLFLAIYIYIYIIIIFF